MKKKLLVFILCFTLSTCGFVHTDPVREVKASVTVVAVSLFLLGLTALGVSYYTSVGSDALSNDIEAYSSSHDTTSANYLNAFQSVVVDTAKNAVKYTAAQVYLLTDFIQYLTNNNKVSEVPITSESFKTVPLMGYPCLLKLSPNQVFTIESNYNSKKVWFKTSNYLYSSDDIYLGFIAGYAINNDKDHSNSSLFRIMMYNFDNNRFPALLYSYDGSSYTTFSSGSYSNQHGLYTESIQADFLSYSTNLMGSSNWLNYNLNGDVFTNLYFFNAYNTGHNSSNFEDAFKLRFGYDISSSSYSGNLTLPSYSVNKEVLSNVASDKDLVITSPDLIDKAVDNAIVRNPSATTITVEDVAAAIDSTAVGVIDPAAEDEDKVIAPPISLDDELSITQDSAITDTVVEDLVIGDPLPPPDPPPVLPDIDVALGSKFPFSIFYDFVAIMALFDATPVAPSFPLGFEFLGNEYEFTIDLSAFDSVARVLRLMELIVFISGLVFLTIRYIRGKD